MKLLIGLLVLMSLVFATPALAVTPCKRCKSATEAYLNPKNFTTVQAAFCELSPVGWSGHNGIVGSAPSGCNVGLACVSGSGETCSGTYMFRKTSCTAYGWCDTVYE